MEIISKIVSLQQLKKYNDELIVNNVAVNKNIDSCNNEITLITDTNTNKFITYKNIFITFPLSRVIKDLGYYDALDESVELSLNIPDNYVVTGEVTSRLDELRTYTGGYVVGVNVSENDNEYSAVISIDGNKITYVIGGLLQDGLYVENSGVIYEDIGDKTYIRYYPNLFDKTYSKYIFKSNKTIGLMKPIKIQNKLFINRGNSSPLGSYYYMRMTNKLDDTLEIPIKIL